MLRHNFAKCDWPPPLAAFTVIVIIILRWLFCAIYIINQLAKSSENAKWIFSTNGFQPLSHFFGIPFKNVKTFLDGKQNALSVTKTVLPHRLHNQDHQFLLILSMIMIMINSWNLRCNNDQPSGSSSSSASHPISSFLPWDLLRTHWQRSPAKTHRFSKQNMCAYIQVRIVLIITDS